MEDAIAGGILKAVMLLGFGCAIAYGIYFVLGLLAIHFGLYRTQDEVEADRIMKEKRGTQAAFERIQKEREKRRLAIR